MWRTTGLFLAVIAPAVLRGPAAQAVQRITVEQAAARIRGTAGPAVIVFYSTTCPLSRAMFPSLVALARQPRATGVTFLVFSVDREADTAAVPAFLTRHAAPFRPVYVQPWAPGTFTRNMATLGITAGQVWTTPLVAVRDRTGRIVTQAQGVTSVAGLADVLATVR